MAEAAKKEAPKKEEAKGADLKVAVAAEGAKGAEAKPKFDLLGLIIFLLVTLNLLALGGMGFFLQKMWDQVQELKTNTIKIAEQQVKPEETSVGKDLEPAALGTLYPMESFLVNINSEAGAKFLQTQMELELAEPAVEEEISRKKAAIRDSIIVLLTSRQYKELRESAGIKKLRSDLVRVINGLLTTGRVKEVYFTQFHFN